MAVVYYYIVYSMRYTICACEPGKNEERQPRYINCGSGVKPIRFYKVPRHLYTRAIQPLARPGPAGVRHCEAHQLLEIGFFFATAYLPLTTADSHGGCKDFSPPVRTREFCMSQSADKTEWNNIFLKSFRARRGSLRSPLKGIHIYVRVCACVRTRIYAERTTMTMTTRRRKKNNRLFRPISSRRKM